jgi:hypothetical protein
MNWPAVHIDGMDWHDLGTPPVLRLPLDLANSCAHGRVRTNALIVPHLLPSEGPCGRMQNDPTAAGTMNVSA